MKLRRVGVVTTSYPRTVGDAAGIVVADHVAELLREGVQHVEVIAAGTGDSSDHNVRVHRIAAPTGLFYEGGAPDALEAGFPLVPAMAFSARLALAVALRARAWDGVIAHWLMPSAIAALPSRGPLLAIAHGGDVHLLCRRRIITPTIAALRARRARIAFVSEDLLELVVNRLPSALAQWTRAASIVQPMGVPLARFEAIASLRASRPRDVTPKVLVLARLVPIKGISIFLHALSFVATPLHVSIAGDGPDRAVLAARIEQLHRTTSHRIKLLGEVAADLRDALLADADLVVIPSIATASGRTEGTPRVALEAMAAGVAVIASRTGGLAALDGAISLVPPSDAAALGREIMTTLTAESGKIAAGRSLARRFDWRAVSARLRDHWLAM